MNPKALSTNPAAVATQHPLAANAARDVLATGGNAVDAAVAAMATLCVVMPGMVGLGGYGGSMVFYSAATKETVALDFDSRAPLAYRDEIFADDFAGKTGSGYLAVTVPAIVAGLAAALQKFGTKTWKEVIAPAAEIAERGFAMDAETRKHLDKWHAGADDLSRRAHFASGKLPEVGQPWIQKDLAALIRKLASDGPESFYRGEIAGRIVKQIRDHGGILSEADFASYQPTLVEPVHINYRGHDIFTPPPPSGGITTLQMLKTLELFDLRALDHFGAAYFHLVAEVAKLCWADRTRALGDPDFVKIPIDDLLSADIAARRASQVRRHDINTGVESLIDSNPHTSNVSVIDREGNAVSMTATQGYQFGSRVVIDGLGLVMGHGMSRFDAGLNHPNRPEPGKRMHHNMSPTIALKNGKPFAALGMPGGPKIVTVTAQLLIDLIDFHCTAAEAVAAPRIHSDGGEPLAASHSLAPGIVRELESMGHRTTLGQTVGGPPTDVGGPANIVMLDAHRRLTAASGAAADAAIVL